MMRCLLPLLLPVTAGVACAADAVFLPLDRPPLLPQTAVLLPIDPASPTPNPSRIRLPRMQAGFLYAPPGLDQDDPAQLAEYGPQPADEGSDWLQLSMGNDNPFFDLRFPGDPGGVGYYRVHSQVQLIDSRTTACTVNLQAVTPAGRDQDGLADGQTVLTPGIAVYQQLMDDGTALQGYVGKHVPFQQTTYGPVPRGGPLHRGMECGLALQRPLWAAGPDGADACYLYLGAVGRVRPDLPTGPTPALDVMPGIHYQMTANGWVGGSVLLPVNNPSRGDGPGWQLTLSWQF